MLAFLREPWPWYIAGPLIGLMVPALLVLGNKSFGFSSNLRHVCAAVFPRGIAFFRYDWKREGGWNLAFLAGTLVGGFAGGWLLRAPVAVSEQTRAALHTLGLRDFSGLVPPEIFSWSALLTPRGLVCVVLGGFLVGFGATYAGGCTSGHGITGLANFERASVIALLAFFLGGLIGTYLLLPLVLR